MGALTPLNCPPLNISGIFSFLRFIAPPKNACLKVPFTGKFKNKFKELVLGESHPSFLQSKVDITGATHKDCHVLIKIPKKNN